MNLKVFNYHYLTADNYRIIITKLYFTFKFYFYTFCYPMLITR